jgi:hypothetical protein
MLPLDVTPALWARFSHIASQMNKKEPECLQEALLAYIQDCEDILDIRARLAEGNPSFPLEEVRRRMDADEA